MTDRLTSSVVEVYGLTMSIHRVDLGVGGGEEMASPALVALIRDGRLLWCRLSLSFSS